MLEDRLRRGSCGRAYGKECTVLDVGDGITGRTPSGDDAVSKQLPRRACGQVDEPCGRARDPVLRGAAVYR